MIPDIQAELSSTLSKNEKLIWWGQPKTGIIFRSADIFLIPFTLVWFSFALFFEFTAIAHGIIPPAIFGLLFCCAGAYIFAGRFFVDSLRRKNTIYGITDNRVIIKSGIFRKEITSLSIRNTPNLTLKEKANGSGTIYLGAGDFQSTMTRSMGSWPGIKQPPGIELIDDVRSVYNLLVEQQQRG